MKPLITNPQRLTTVKRTKQILIAAIAATLLYTGQTMADPLALRGIKSTAASQEAAMQEATQQALKQALVDLHIDATESQSDRILAAHPEYFARTIISIEKTNDSVSLVVDFTVDGDSLRSVLTAREVAKNSEALGRPHIAFAIIPRGPEGGKLEPGTKQYFTEQLNTALQEVFVDAGFSSVYPDWMLKELDAFSGDPAHDTAYERDLIMHAKMDADTHYLITGAATIDVENTGGESEVHLSVNGQVLNTFTENDLAVPFQFTGTIRGATERVAIAQACSIIGERAARQKAVPRLVRDWNDQVEKGTEYWLDVFYDSPAFKKQMLAALESAGEILDLNSVGSDMLRLRYQTKSVQRKDFGDSFLLGRRFKDMPAGFEFFSMANQSVYVLGPDKASYRRSGQAIISGQRYTLIDLKSLPPSLQQKKVSDEPVNPDPDTALAMVACRYADAVGVVTFAGNGELFPDATAWAFGKNLFASNAHVTTQVQKYMNKGVEAYIYLNGKQGQRLRIVKVYTHPKYTTDGIGYDVGILQVEGSVSTWFPLADGKELQSVAAGTRIAYLGFPMEGMFNENINIASPVAIMQSGIISAVTDYDFRKSGFADSYFFRHNLPSAGGASGSPIFDAHGAVIALLSGGNVVNQPIKVKNEQTGVVSEDVTRAPSAVLVNFAHRVDLLKDVLKQVQ